MATSTDIRQMRSRDTLDRITGVADSKLDLIVRDLNSEITPPLPFSVTGANRVVTIGNITRTNPTTGLNRTIPPISNLLPSFTSATVTMSATGAGTATPSVGSAINLGMTASQFLKIAVNIDATGSITLTSGTAGASLAAATTPASISGLFAVGFFVVRTDGSNNVANVLTTDLYQYVGGGGSGGSGTGNPTLESIKNEFVDSPYELVTPNIIATDGQSKIATLSGATYDLITNTIKFSANSQSATSTQQLDTAEFLSRALDVGAVDLSVFWNLGTSLQTFAVPDAATSYSSLSASTLSGSAVVTVTTTVPHHLVTGSRITVTTSTAIGGISAAGGNLSVSNVAVTVLNEFQFTFTAGASASSSATGILDTVTVLGFLYEVSRDGTSNWFTVPMTRVGTTNVFRGPLIFDTTTTTESTNQTVKSQAAQTSTSVITDVAGGVASIGQGFTLTNTARIKKVVLNLSKGTGTPVGNIFISMIKDVGGFPSTNAADVLTQSSAILISGIGLTTSPANYTFDIPQITLASGIVYHVVMSTDTTYKAGYTSNNNNVIKSGYNNSGATSPFLEIFNSTVWSTPGSFNLTYQLLGRALDLRVRISSPSTGTLTYPIGLDGWGIFYNLQDVGIVGASRKTQRFGFNSVTDNLSTFTISAFNPDPDLLQCYYVEAGQVFKVPAFTLNGNVVTFATNTFNNGGVSAPVTLIFDQNNGGAFDNADSNVRVLAANHLGSTSGADDKSAAGRGILLRNAAGTLVELALDANNNIIILSTP